MFISSIVIVVFEVVLVHFVFVVEINKGLICSLVAEIGKKIVYIKS